MFVIIQTVNHLRFRVILINCVGMCRCHTSVKEMCLLFVQEAINLINYVHTNSNMFM